MWFNEWTALHDNMCSDQTYTTSEAYFYNNSQGRTHESLSKEPNDQLIDFYGHLWEWLTDHYVPGHVEVTANKPYFEIDCETGEDYYEMPETFHLCVGGSWHDEVDISNINELTHYLEPSARSNTLGIRIVRSGD